MCNAKKHSPGCSCGFGPPYPPRYRVGEVREWAAEVVDRPSLLRRGLREEGWDERSISAFAERFATMRRSSVPRSTQVERVKEWLGMRKRVVEKTWTEVVHVPLYRFGAPPVPGAKVEYSEGETIREGAGWRLKFWGVGIGDSTSLEISRTCFFTASNGDSKEVFVPVMVRVSRVAIYDGDQVVGYGHEAQVASPEESGDPLLKNRGIRLVTDDPENGGAQARTYHEVIDLSLSGDSTDAVHKERRSWSTDVAHDVSVPLMKVPGLDVAALVNVKRTRQLALVMNLPSGHDYRGLIGNGFLVWEAPRRAAAKRRRRTRGATAA